MRVTPPAKEPLSQRSRQVDRIVAYVVYAVTGLLLGVAIAIFTNTMWILPVIGLLVGLAWAVHADRKNRLAEES